MKEKTPANDTSQPGDQPEKKSKGLMIGLIAGGAALLLCCCTGIGGGVGVWFFAMRNVNQTLIVGVWQEQAVRFEFRDDGKLKRQGFDLVYKFVDRNTIEIGPDKQGNNTLNGQPYPTIRYRVEVKTDTLTLTEVSPPPAGEQAEKYVLKRR
jgi:hypothetical protein